MNNANPTRQFNDRRFWVRVISDGFAPGVKKGEYLLINPDRTPQLGEEVLFQGEGSMHLVEYDGTQSGFSGVVDMTGRDRRVFHD